MFVDEVSLEVRGGRGGNGAVSFRREKYEPHGGPDGGDGGEGGSVYFVADESLSTLLDYKYRKHLKASSGGHGEGGNRHGKRGEDLYIPVPPGTVIKDEEDNILADLALAGGKVLAARGGEGGRGNRKFASSRHQAPRMAEKGEPGEVRNLKLELKLLADVGLVGLPNAGKSTLLSHLSSARPKIAEYEFTTLNPQLGVVYHRENSFVLADLPGIIEGAARGAGLGYRFLKHSERASILLHLLDVSDWAGEDPVETFYKLDKEILEFSEKLAHRPRIVVGNKMDLDGAAENLARLQKELAEDARLIAPVKGISAATGEGIKELLDILVEKVEQHRREVPRETYIAEEAWQQETESEELMVEKQEDYYLVKGKKIQSLVARTDFNNEEALQRFWNITRKMGLNEKLQEQGVQPGDTVVIGEQEFDFWPESNETV